jgi:hypothetical protein
MKRHLDSMVHKIDTEETHKKLKHQNEAKTRFVNAVVEGTNGQLNSDLANMVTCSFDFSPIILADSGESVEILYTSFEEQQWIEIYVTKGVYDRLGNVYDLTFPSLFPEKTLSIREHHIYWQYTIGSEIRTYLIGYKMIQANGALLTLRIDPSKLKFRKCVPIEGECVTDNKDDDFLHGVLCGRVFNLCEEDFQDTFKACVLCRQLVSVIYGGADGDTKCYFQTPFVEAQIFGKTTIHPDAKVVFCFDCAITRGWITCTIDELMSFLGRTDPEDQHETRPFFEKLHAEIEPYRNVFDKLSLKY